MWNTKPERRPAERNAGCRACDKEISKGTEMVSWYSSANRGMYIHICIPCAISVGDLAKNTTASGEVG